MCCGGDVVGVLVGGGACTGCQAGQATDSRHAMGHAAPSILPRFPAALPPAANSVHHHLPAAAAGQAGPARARLRRVHRDRRRCARRQAAVLCARPIRADGIALHPPARCSRQGAGRRTQASAAGARSGCTTHAGPLHTGRGCNRQHARAQDTQQVTAAISAGQPTQHPACMLPAAHDTPHHPL